MDKSLLVVAAHPDDEILGCGGTLCNYIIRGYNVHVAFMADGEKSRLNEQSIREKHLINERKKIAKKALKTLGITSVSFHNFPDNAMDTIPLLDVTKEVEKLIMKFQPQIILTHFSGDVNIDHQKTHESVLTACRPQNKYSVRKILCFEIPSSTEWQFELNKVTFAPNYFVDISHVLEKKLEALNFYDKEMREWPHPRSIKGITYLSNWRGATIGVNAAEAFMLARYIDK